MYHIYNRANGSDRLFRSPENYRYLLEKYQQHILPIADTFCYCLMPNHFHFLVRIKPEDELRAAFPKFKTLEKLPSKAFSNLFSAYTQAFNKRQDRMGSLFMKNFKRKKITDRSYLINLVRYIHNNPIEANLCDHITDWKYSSYHIILSDAPSFIERKEVLSWFEDRNHFRREHHVPAGILSPLK
jgi:REP element-mobilizing transposase RayT